MSYDFSNEYHIMRDRFDRTVNLFKIQLDNEIVQRVNNVASSDMKLMKCLLASINYIFSKYKQEWRIVTSDVTQRFIKNLEYLLDCPNNDLQAQCFSIIDLQMIYDESENLIYHLVATFDPDHYTLRPSLKERIQRLISLSSLS